MDSNPHKLSSQFATVPALAQLSQIWHSSRNKNTTYVLDCKLNLSTITNTTSIVNSIIHITNHIDINHSYIPANCHFCIAFPLNISCQAVVTYPPQQRGIAGSAAQQLQQLLQQLLAPAIGCVWLSCRQSRPFINY